MYDNAGIMLKAHCHCGRVSLELCRRPDFINECNCSLCRKAGASWGYFEPSEVTITGTTTGYVRPDKSEPRVELHFCPQCGTATHFVPTGIAMAKHGDTMVGVNMKLMDGAELAGVELRYPDGQKWSGKGKFGFVRDATVMG